MRATSYTVEGGAGALSTTPAAPCISAIMASWMTRGPVVVPPPTPTNSGAWAAVSRAWVMTGSPVNGYTARMASALVLRMMAASVVNANEWSWRPWTVMPEVQLMMSGTRAAEELMRFSMGSVRLLDGIPGRIR